MPSISVVVVVVAAWLPAANILADPVDYMG